MKAADLQHRSTLPLLVKLLVDNQLPAALVGHCHAERSEASRQFVGRPLGNETTAGILRPDKSGLRMTGVAAVPATSFCHVAAS